MDPIYRKNQTMQETREIKETENRLEGTHAENRRNEINQSRKTRNFPFTLDGESLFGDLKGRRPASNRVTSNPINSSVLFGRATSTTPASTLSLPSNSRSVCLTELSALLGDLPRRETVTFANPVRAWVNVLFPASHLASASCRRMRESFWTWEDRWLAVTGT